MMTTHRPAQSHSAYYSAPVSAFVASSTQQVLEAITSSSGFDITLEQRSAWEEEIDVLQRALITADRKVESPWCRPVYKSAERRRLGNGPKEA
jgi:hypothetical protein